MTKFKIGDEVKFIGNDANYYFHNDRVRATENEIFIISAVSDDRSSPIYSVEGAYIQRPNWHNMEDNFVLARRNWKKVLEK